MRLIGSVLFVVTGIVLSAGASAHHSFASEFDPDSRGAVSGTITRVQFTNPHVRYRLSVVNESGTAEEWELQLSSVTSLRGANWFSDTVQVGQLVTAEGELGRNGARKLFIRELQLSDGTRISTRGGPAIYTDPAELDVDDGDVFAYGQLNQDHPIDISGPWNNRHKFTLTVDDLEPKPTPFTAEGRRVFESTSHYDDYALRCMSLGLPRLFGSPYNMEIADAGAHYIVLHVQNNLARRIFMDGREPPENIQPTSNGFSVGHWEGNDLVIETTHLLAGWLDGSGLPMSGDGTRILERWTFDDRRVSMDRVMTIYDPYYSEPLVRRRGSSRGDNIEIVEQASCDPDGYYRDLLDSGQLEQRLR